MPFKTISRNTKYWQVFLNTFALVHCVWMVIAFAGVARAFDEATHTHPVLLDVVEKYWGAENVDAAKRKLAEVTRF